MPAPHCLGGSCQGSQAQFTPAAPAPLPANNKLAQLRWETAVPAFPPSHPVQGLVPQPSAASGASTLPAAQHPLCSSFLRAPRSGKGHVLLDRSASQAAGLVLCTRTCPTQPPSLSITDQTFPTERKNASATLEAGSKQFNQNMFLVSVIINGNQTRGSFKAPSLRSSYLYGSKKRVKRFNGRPALSHPSRLLSTPAPDSRGFQQFYLSRLIDAAKGLGARAPRLPADCWGEPGK